MINVKLGDKDMTLVQKDYCPCEKRAQKIRVPCPNSPPPVLHCPHSPLLDDTTYKSHTGTSQRNRPFQFLGF